MDYIPRISAEELLSHARAAGAFWEWRGEHVASTQGGGPPPHAKLRGGLHSDGYFMAKQFFKTRGMLGVVARQMEYLLEDEDIPRPFYIVGVPTSATKLGKCLAGFVGSRYALVEKRSDNSFELVTPLIQCATILVVEDVLKSGESVAKVARAILKKSPTARILPHVLTLLNRGGRKEISVCDDGLGLRAHSLIEKQMMEWTPDSCPLCSVGSQAISPKEPAENWQRLNNER